MAREEFNAPTRKALAERVAYRCANPDCDCITIGPHTEPARTVNIGVAAHIAAASPGGPRFDANQTPEERRSIENAIWLCQVCAKLVDSDCATYTAATLKQWKIDREAGVQRALSRAQTDDFYPRSGTESHAPIPRMRGQALATARDRLLSAGWLPVLNHWSYAEDERIRYGVGKWIWARGFHEITDACATGLAYCKLKYRDAYRNELVLITAGEPAGDDGDVMVWTWSIWLQERITATDREFARVAAQIREEGARAKEHLQRAVRAERNLKASGGASEDVAFAIERRAQLVDRALARLLGLEANLDTPDRAFYLPELDALLLEIRGLAASSKEEREALENELRDRPDLQLATKRYPAHPDYGPERLSVIMVNHGRRPVVLHRIGGYDADGRFCATDLASNRRDIRLGEFERFEKTLMPADTIGTPPEGDIPFEVMWIEDSLGRRHEIPGSREYIMELGPERL